MDRQTDISHSFNFSLLSFLLLHTSTLGTHCSDQKQSWDCSPVAAKNYTLGESEAWRSLWNAIRPRALHWELHSLCVCAGASSSLGLNHTDGAKVAVNRKAAEPSQLLWSLRTSWNARALISCSIPKHHAYWFPGLQKGTGTVNLKVMCKALLAGLAPEKLLLNQPPCPKQGVLMQKYDIVQKWHFGN